MSGESACDETIVLQSIARHVNSLADDSRLARKKSVEAIGKELNKEQTDVLVRQKVFQSILKNVLKLWSDPVEKCRELSISLTFQTVKESDNIGVYLPALIPLLVQRLGQQDIVEPSEEIRFQLVKLLAWIIETAGKLLASYLDELISVLQRVIVDPYPEVKKESCRCASAVAKAIPEQFHMQSGSLIPPLQTTISHQHSRVRVEAIHAIGDVIQYGNGKSVDDVVSHLAQRLFDHAPAVRTAVTQVVGMWLLELMDRYSFFHKLIPLLMTSLTDEVNEIREQAEGLWNDIGLKYELENEDDLKDKQDFVKPQAAFYPSEVCRPNLGCRHLVYRHFSKILPGLLRDMTDWVVETRVKSAQLLYSLILNEEDNTTQHVDKILAGLYRACQDEEPRVAEKSAELLGLFIAPEVWTKLLLSNVRSTQSPGSLLTLAAVLRGSNKNVIEPFVKDVADTLCDSNVCRGLEDIIQRHLLSCVGALICTSGELCSRIDFEIFTSLMTVLALHRSDEHRIAVQKHFKSLAVACSYSDQQELFAKHSVRLVQNLREESQWTQHSAERFIFETLLLHCGPVAGELLDDVVPMFVSNMGKKADPEVKAKLFTLLSKLMLKSSETLDSSKRFGEYAVTIVREIILPNCDYAPGRTAAAMRTTAVSCLWALIQSDVLSEDMLAAVAEEILLKLTSLLEEDLKNTRLVTCRVFAQLFGKMKGSLNQDRLHNLYPELLKRLDDSSDDIRIEMCRVFVVYFACFDGTYDVSLYRAHLEALFTGLLIHLDDPETVIQDAVLDVLKAAGTIESSMLINATEAVMHKHRSARYCNQLIEYLQKIQQQQKAI